MGYCNKIRRPCSCGRLVTYDRQGRLNQSEGDSGCLTDNEVRSMLTILLQEWRRRCQAMEGEELPASYH